MIRSTPRTAVEAAATAPAENVARGAGFILTAAVTFSLMGVIVRELSSRVTPEVMVFCRNAFGLLFVVPWLAQLRLRGLKTRVLHLHLLRAAAGTTAIYALFFAVARLHLAEAVLLNQCATLFIPFVAWFWLKEPVPVRVRWALGAGFAGVLLVLKPGAGLLSWAALAGLASGMAAAVSMVTIRRMSRSEPPARIVFYFAVFGTLVSAAPLYWSWQTPGLIEILGLIAIGALATLGQILVTRAYACAPAAQIGPFTYASVVIAAGMGWMFWGEIPDRWSALGALLIAAGGVYTARRRHMHR